MAGGRIAVARPDAAAAAVTAAMPCSEFPTSMAIS